MKLGKSLSSGRIVVGAVCVASVTSVACSSSSARAPGIDTAAETAALDSPNGRIEPGSKELPGFGDPEVEALPLMEEPTAARSSAASLAAGETAYRLVLVWGHLPPAHDSTSTDVAPGVVQWTGSLRADAGAIDLLRTIALGPTDHLDATIPGAISFRSQTDAYVAGILVRVRVPQGSRPTLQLATSLVAVAIDLSTLEERAGGITRAAAEGGAGLGWFGFREDLCSRGFVLGRWVKDAPAVGRAFAAVTDADGALLGYERGIWGYARGRSGEVWFDKYIDVDGNAKGLAFGWYGDGFFRGAWGATGEDEVSALEVGKTEGLYADADAIADGRGVWLGRWSAPCAP